MVLTNWLAEIFMKGGPIFMVPLTLMSVLGLATFLDRALFFRKSNIVSKEFGNFLEGFNQGSHSPEDVPGKCLASTIVKSALADHRHSDKPQEEIITRHAEYHILQLSKRLWVFSALGNLAPMLGLLGTVVGLVKAFAQISEAGMSPEVVSAGISIALITTVTGLTIALPNLLAYYGFKAWADKNFHLVKYSLETYINKVS